MVIAALFFVFLIAGGVGPHEPIANAAIQAAGFVMLAALASRESVWSAPRPGAATALLLLLAILIVGLAQLTPMPFATWRALPGRDSLATILETVGLGGQPRPLTLSRDGTRDTLLFLIAPAAILVATMLSSTRQRVWLAGAAGAAAMLSCLLAFVQLSLGDGTLMPYPLEPYDRIPGIFANFNHQALFLACAAALLPVAVADSRIAAVRWPLVGGTGALLAAGVAITASRAGLALFVLAAIWCGVQWRPRRSGKRRRAESARRWRPLALGAGAAAITLAALWLAAGSYRGEVIRERIGDASTDARFAIARKTLGLIGNYFPAGTGFGTFIPIYRYHEAITEVGPAIVNHAHNDFLELWLEAGLAGMVWLALALVWFGNRVIAAARLSRHSTEGRLARAGIAIVLLALLHSLVDYPLRTQTLACLFAFACGLLIPAPETRSTEPPR